MFGAKSAAVVFVQAELCPISCENSPKFVTMATRVSPGKILMVLLIRFGRPGKPRLDELGGSSICTIRVMADLGRKWSKFQKSISQRIFNQSSPDFYPHWHPITLLELFCDV